MDMPTITRGFRLGFAAIALAIMLPAGSVSADTAAASSQPSYSDICSVDQLVDQTADTAADKISKQALRTACLKYQSQALAILTQQTKASQLESALQAFSSVQGLEGTVSNSSAADHIGQGLAQEVLAKAAWQIAQDIAKDKIFLQQGNDNCETAPPYEPPKIVLLSKADLDNKLLVDAEVQWLLTAANNIKLSARAVDEDFAELQKEHVAKVSTHRMVVSGSRYSVAAVISLIPPAVSAAEALAGLLKTNSSLSSISLPAQTQTVIVELSRDTRLRCSIHFTQNIKDNKFYSAFSDLFQLVEDANGRLQKANAEVASKGGMSKVNSTFGSDLQEYRAQIAAAKAVVDLYNTVANGQTQSPYEQMLIQAAKASPPTDYYLLIINADSFGVNGGVNSSKWRSDNLMYSADAVVSFALLKSDGTSVQSGIVETTGNLECNPTDRCLTKAEIQVRNLP